MFILKNILTPLQNAFSSTNLGRDRGHLFTYTILAFIIPFTSSISSNVFRCINTLFGLNVNKRRFYAFMVSFRQACVNEKKVNFHVFFLRGEDA